MITRDDIDRLSGSGANVIDSEGNKIGTLRQLYLDDRHHDPTWITVVTGLFGTKETFVPLDEATLQGSEVRVPYTKDQVKDAPRVDPEGELSVEEEELLYRHYGLTGMGTSAGGTAGTEGYATTGTGGYTDTAGTGTDTGTYTDAAETRGTTGRDTTDDAMTRSEEQLRVGRETREAGRARLRKYIVTENVTETVPVSREEARIEREPITDANIGDAMSGPVLKEDEHEVTLHEERPFVEKETVPVERVRLDTDTVTDEETVSEEVRKERIETDGTDETGRRGR
ncbi:DUF2382 domain-containing protein [Arthrobacter sp. GCM10027362]|uniref:DUF2382 domain-containing protein n=1 Tax=Arthrobacter sp. GCM10027362 TaxID=3273379 RepID=UPI003640E567